MEVWILLKYSHENFFNFHVKGIEPKKSQEPQWFYDIIDFDLFL